MHDTSPSADHIVFAFEPELACPPRAGLAAIGDIIVIAYGFGADKALFKIRVNDAGAACARPVPCSIVSTPAPPLRPRGEESDKVQELVASANDTRLRARPEQPIAFEVGLLFGLEATERFSSS